MAIDRAEGTPVDVPTCFQEPPSNLDLPHSLYVQERAVSVVRRGGSDKHPSSLQPSYRKLNIPLPSLFQAQTLYRVLSVDKPLRPKDAHVAFRIVPSDSSQSIIARNTTTLDILIHTSTVRQMRFSSNAIFDDVTLVLETMQAFSEDKSDTTIEAAVKEQEFELNGVGRAG